MFIQETVQSIKKLYEVTKDQANFLNRHAELHEMHHKSFFSASQAVKKLREHAMSSENDMAQIKEAMIKMRSEVGNMHARMQDLIKDTVMRHDAMQLREADPMKNAIKYLNERIINIGGEVEHSRNKILNLEERTFGSFDGVTEEIKTKTFEMDNTDDKIKEVVAKTLSEHEVGKNIMEALAEGLHAQGSEITKLRKDIDLTNEQLPQLAAQYSELQHNHLQLEAEVGRLGEVLQQYKDGSFQGPGGGRKDGQGGAPDMSPPGIGPRPQMYNMSGGQHIETKLTMDPWQQWLHNIRRGNFHITNSVQASQQAEPQSRSEKGFDDLNKKSVFSEKVAMSPENGYDGEHKGAQWRLNGRPYLISRAPSIAHVLQYVLEHEDQSALIENLLPHVSVPKSMLMLLFVDLRGFLTFNLQGTTKIWVNNSKMMEGFDFWRKAMKSVRSRKYGDTNFWRRYKSFQPLANWQRCF